MEALRQIPPINDVLDAPRLASFRGLLQTPFGARILNDVLGETRRQLANEGEVIARPELTSRIAERIATRLQESLTPSLRRVINASGVVLHTNLGRAPLPASAIEHLRDVATHYSNLE